MSQVAGIFNAGLCEQWGVNLAEFSGRRSPRSRAEAIDRRRERLVGLTLELAGDSLSSLRRDLLAIGDRPAHEVAAGAIHDARRRLAGDLAQAALVAHLASWHAALAEVGMARGRRKARAPVGMTRWARGADGWAPAAVTERRSLSKLTDEARRFVEGRLKLTEEDVARIKAVYGPYAMQLASEVVGESARLRLEETLSGIIRDNLHVAQASARLSETLAAMGLTPSSPYRIEATARTQIQLAYSAAAVQADRHPAVDEILWGYEYSTVGDDRVRPTHAALEGVRMPKRDPRWEKLMPPNGFACRCTALRVFDQGTPIEPKDAVEIDGVQVRPGADSGFEFNPGDLFDAVVKFPAKERTS